MKVFKLRRKKLDIGEWFDSWVLGVLGVVAVFALVAIAFGLLHDLFCYAFDITHVLWYANDEVGEQYGKWFLRTEFILPPFIAVILYYSNATRNIFDLHDGYGNRDNYID